MGPLSQPYLAIHRKFINIYIYEGMHLPLPPISHFVLCKIGRENIYNTYFTCLPADPTLNPGRSEGKAI